MFGIDDLEIAMQTTMDEYAGDFCTIQKFSCGNKNLIETLDEIEIAENIFKPLRLPIQNVYKFDERRIIAGQIESGDSIKISP